jgi:hypothetical protein
VGARRWELGARSNIVILSEAKNPYSHRRRDPFGGLFAALRMTDVLAYLPVLPVVPVLPVHPGDLPPRAVT